MIIIGLGTGRCGTQTLARLLNMQKSALITHEKNPHTISWIGSDDVILSNIQEFEQAIKTGKPELSITHFATNKNIQEKMDSIKSVKLVGDVAFYYLPYVRLILKKNFNIQFICLQRDEEETVNSYIKKTRGKKRRGILDKLFPSKERNPWIHHNGRKWSKDPLWDKCYPKYDINNKKEAIRLYWQEYYQTASELQQEFPENFRIFPMESLNSIKGQKEILSFVRITENNMILNVGLKENVSDSGRKQQSS